MFNKLKMVSNENPKKDWLKEDTDKTVSSFTKDKGKKAKPAKSSHCKIVSTVNDNTVLKSMARNGDVHAHAVRTHSPYSHVLCADV